MELLNDLLVKLKSDNECIISDLTDINCVNPDFIRGVLRRNIVIISMIELKIKQLQ